MVQVDLAFKIYRSGETRAHVSSAAGGGEGGGGEGKGGDKERKERPNDISKEFKANRQGLLIGLSSQHPSNCSLSETPEPRPNRSRPSPGSRFHGFPTLKGSLLPVRPL